MNKYASLYIDVFFKAAEEAEEKKSKRKVPAKHMNAQGFDGVLADTVPVAEGFSNTRAGRATAMGQAAGADIPKYVRYPATMSALTSLAGALAGAGIGAYAGRGSKDRMQLGATAGAILGGLTGNVAAGTIRHKGIKEMEEAYDNADSINPEAAKPKRYGILKSMLLLGAAPHRQGQAEAYDSISRGESPGWDSHLRAVDHLIKRPGISGSEALNISGIALPALGLKPLTGPINMYGNYKANR